MQNCHRKIVLSVVAIFCIVLFLIAYFGGFTPTNDGVEYIEQALICIHSGTLYPCSEIYQTKPFIWHCGAINAIVLSLKLFHSVTPLMYVYAILQAALAYLIYNIGEKLTNNFWISFTAMLLFVCYPNNWGAHTTLLSEIPMLFLSLLAIRLFLCNRISTTLLCGAIFAVANWFRPIAIIFICALILYSLINKKKKDVLRHSVAMIGAYVAVILLIGSACYLRTGHFVYQNESFWYNMADDAYDGATTDPHYGEPLFKKGTPRYVENMQQYDCFELNEIWKQRCMTWLKSHPLTYLSKVPDRLFYMYRNDIDNLIAFLPDKTNAENNYILIPLRHLASEFTQMTAIQHFALFQTIVYWLILLLALAAIPFTRRRNSLSLICVALGTLAIVLSVQGETRFKAPLMPFIFIMAATTIVQIFTRYAKRKSRLD